MPYYEDAQFMCLYYELETKPLCTILGNERTFGLFKTES